MITKIFNKITQISIYFLISTLFLFLPYSFAGQNSTGKKAAKEKEVAMVLAFQEAQIMLAQRQRPWEKEEKPKALAKEERRGGPLKIEGYYKNLFANSKTTDTQEGFYSDLQRLRLDSRLDFSDNLKLKVVFDQEAISGDFANTADFNSIRNKDQKKLSFLDLDHVSTDRDHLYLKSSLYRAYLKYDTDKLQVVLGKQLIDWGRCRFWSPLDLFNPASPLNIERDERIGVDALNLELVLNSLSYLNFVYAPRENFGTSSQGLRLYHQAGNYDLFLVAGEFKKDEVLGFAFDGYIGQGGIRGEFTQTHADNGRDFFRGVIGAEYNFPSRLYLLGEYFYNAGAEDNNTSNFLTSYELSSRALSLKKQLLGLWVSYEASPLLKLNNFTSYDIEEGSIFLNPEIKYNLITNLDLSLGIQLFWGSNESEFGLYQHSYYFQLQYFF